MAIIKEATILIVDDNLDFHTVASVVFKRMGYSVKSFFEGKAQLIHAAAASCDIILLDVDLPGDSGIEISKLLKSDPECAHVPIILITGNIDGDTLCDQSKADACLLKPFTSRELVEKIEYFLKKEDR